MQKGIHPQTFRTQYICNSCGTTFNALSTSEDNIHVEVCSNCHPHYTGEAGTIVDTFSRVDRFNKQQEAAASSNVVLKKVKKQERRQKSTEIKAGPAVTLRDMLKQVG